MPRVIEAETVALAVEQPADIVLLDEAEARKVADTYSLKKTGTIGLLMRAKNEGKIPALKDALDRLQNDAGFWVDAKLYAQALAAVGE